MLNKNVDWISDFEQKLARVNKGQIHIKSRDLS
jgi:hypothetical protein